MSFVERSIILCPYLRGSTIGGSTVCNIMVQVFDWIHCRACGRALSKGTGPTQSSPSISSELCSTCT